ncbi:MAG: response regulator [Fretibacterium sp.]|nr:response regulator [Fretibacterium sp.]
MAWKVMLINHGAALMAKRLGTLLGAAGIELITVEPVIGNIKEMEDNAGGMDAYILSAGDFGHESMDVLAYLKDVCLKTDKPLFVMGYEKELAEVEKTISKDLIAKEFVRPFDVTVIVRNIQLLVCSDVERKREESILLVDDDITFLKMMQSLIGRKYHVTAVCSGEEAIEYLQTGRTADLILLDYDMPGKTGPQVLETLRKDPKSADIPVIFLTGKNDRDSVMSVMSLKPEGYILKSMSSDDILGSVNRFFKTKK